jgi:hypothetical protein
MIANWSRTDTDIYPENVEILSLHFVSLVKEFLKGTEPCVSRAHHVFM